MSATGPAKDAWLKKVPDGDTHERLVCPDCGYVEYDNPKIVVGAVCTWEDRILLCRRAINPRKGFWVFPAGYLELRETTAAGACREAREEAGVEIEIDHLLAVYTTLEAGLFRWDEIPWDDLAFPTVRWALTHHNELRGQTDFAPRGNPPGESSNYLKTT
jgi:8-oxo-dGTP pyrophosphatase MutT (NUDIX family)